MSLKAKGTNAERELVHKFWEQGWACVRVAGSGSSKYPSPDLLAGNNLRKLAIECKVVSNDAKYFSKEEVEGLVFFAQTFGAQPWIAIKMARKWHFISIDDMGRTPSGYVITLDICEKKGFSFEEVVRGM